MTTSTWRRPLLHGLLAAATLLVTAGTLPTPAHANGPNTGKVTVFIGHSYFARIGEFFDDIATEGTQQSPPTFVGHEYAQAFSGGATGSPEALWNNPYYQPRILQRLSRGDVELFGMTYHDSMTPGTTYYELWIDEAVAANPDVEIFIGLPWTTNAPYSDATQLHAQLDLNTDLFYASTIAPLRTQYPNTTIHFIAYGRIISQMMLDYEAGLLPDIVHEVLPAAYDPCVSGGGEVTVTAPGCTLPADEVEDAVRASLFLDDFGHASTMAKHVMAMTWLHFLYEADGPTLTSLADPGFAFADLSRLVRHSVRENRPYRP